MRATTATGLGLGVAMVLGVLCLIQGSGRSTTAHRIDAADGMVGGTGNANLRNSSLDDGQLPDNVTLTGSILLGAGWPDDPLYIYFHGDEPRTRGVHAKAQLDVIKLGSPLPFSLEGMVEGKYYVHVDPVKWGSRVGLRSGGGLSLVVPSPLQLEVHLLDSVTGGAVTSAMCAWALSDKRDESYEVAEEVGNGRHMFLAGSRDLRISVNAPGYLRIENLSLDVATGASTKTLRLTRAAGLHIQVTRDKQKVDGEVFVDGNGVMETAWTTDGVADFLCLPHGEYTVGVVPPLRLVPGGGKTVVLKISEVTEVILEVMRK